MEEPSAKQLKSELNAARYRLGVANLFFNGEENCLGGIGIFILKALGGNDTHFSLLGAFGSLVVLLQWIAVPVLNYFRSNRKAMAFSLALGVGCSMLLAGSGLTIGGPAVLQHWMLWLFPVCSLLMSMATGMQGTIETSWIGDLVPQSLRGWFYSVKSIVSIVGMAVLSMLFGFLVDYRGSLGATTFWLYVVVALSHLLAIMLIWRIPDATPKPARVFAWRQDGEARVNFKSPVFWGLCAFHVCWTTGRTVFGLFYSVFLLQEFGFGLLGLNSLNLVTWLLSAGMLLLMGRLGDRRGNRRPLMFVSSTVGTAMLVMLLTPWIGVKAVFFLTVLNGLAGPTHTLLLTNYMLEILPAEGRATYIAATRMVVGVFGMVGTMGAGAVGRILEVHDWSLRLGAVAYTRYHLIFVVGAFIAMASSVWLLAVGNRIVQPLQTDRASENEMRTPG